MSNEVYVQVSVMILQESTSYIIFTLCYVYLNVQMRSKNNFVLNSEWSDAIVIDLLNVTVESNTTFEPPDVTERVQLPPYVFAVIAVAIVILLAILIVLACSCIAYVRKHFFISIVSFAIACQHFFVHAFSTL